MKMKKFLLALTLLTFVTPLPLVLTQCSAKKSKNLTSEQKALHIMILLIKGIDGVELTIDNTYEELIANVNKMIAKIHQDASVKLKDATQGKWKLPAGDTNINIVITVGSFSEDFTFKLKDIPNSLMSANERLDHVANYFSKNIDGSSLNSSQKYSDGIAVIINELKKMDSGLTVSFTSSNDAAKQLLAGDNSFDVTYKIDGITRQFVGLKLTNVKIGNESVDESIMRLIVARLDETVNGTGLSTNEKITDALNLINNCIYQISPTSNATLTLPNQAGNNLVLNTNTIGVLVTVNNLSRSTSVQVTGIVAPSGQTPEEILASIVTRLNETIDGSDLTTDNAVSDALALINSIIMAINANGSAVLQDNNILNSKLVAGDNTLSIKLTYSNLDPVNLDVVLTGVVMSEDDVTNQVVNSLISGVDGSSLKTSNDNADALNLITNVVKQVVPNVNLSLVDNSQINNPLKFGMNNLRIKINNRLSPTMVQVMNVGWSDMDKLGNVIIQLNKTVDGKLLDTSKKGIDALALINGIITGLGYGGSASFVNTNDAERQLTLGTNNFAINVNVGTANQQINVDVTHVFLSSDDELTNIKNLLSQTIDGSSLNSSKKGSDALILINSVITSLGYGRSASFVNTNDATRQLLQGTNSFDINVMARNSSSQITVGITNVLLSNTDKIAKIFDVLNQTVDGTLLDTSKKGSDALALINSVITSLGYGGTASFVNDTDTTTQLKSGTNTFNIYIMVGTSTSEITVDVTNVGLSDNAKLADVITRLNQTIDGSSLDTSKKGSDALTLINSFITNLGFGGAASFVTPTDATKSLTLGTNSFTLTVVVGGASQQVTVEVVNVALSQDAKLANIIDRLNQTIDGSSLDTSKTGADALGLINNIIAGLGFPSTASFANENDAARQLKFGLNSFVLDVTFEDSNVQLTVQVTNVALSQDDKLTNIINKLNENIDGSTLDTSKKGVDALALINDIITSLGYGGIATFVNTTDATRQLESGTNSFDLIISVGTLTLQVTANVTDVSLSDSDKLAKILALLNQTIDGSTLDTSKKGTDALVLINGIITGLGYGGSATFVNTTDATKLLTNGSNSFVLTVAVGDVSQQITVQIVNVPLSSADKLAKIIDRLSQTIDGSSLDSSKIGNDALALINNIISNLGYGGNANFITGTDATRHLNEGDNSFIVNIMVENATQQINFVVVNVKLSNGDQLANVINWLSQTIDGTSLDTSRTGADALTLINNFITNLGYDGSASFVNATDANAQLLQGNNSFDLDVTVGTTTQQVTVQVANVALSNADKLAKIIAILNQAIDGSSLDTSKTGADALTLINNIITSLGYGGSVAFVNSADATQRLVASTNSFILEVNVGTSSQQINVQLVNVALSHADKLADIISKLTQSIDGSSLDTNSNGSDALTLINGFISSLGNGGVASFVIPNDATQKLNEGLNSFNLNVTVGDASQQVTVQVINVKLSDDAKLANIISTLNETVNGSSLDTSKTGADALTLINNIIASLGYGRTATFVVNDDATQQLKMGTNNFEINVTLGTITQKITVQVINVPLSSADKLAKIIDRLNQIIDGSSLDTSKIGNDALALINGIITSLVSDGTSSFVTIGDDTQKLKFGNNSFVLNVVVGGASQQITVLVVNVPLSSADKLANIISRLNNTVDGASLDTTMTGDDALTLINNIITSLGYGSTATFVNTNDALRKLVVGINEFDLRITIGTTTQEITVEVNNVTLSNADKIAKIINILNETIDGSSLDTSKKGTDALSLINTVINSLGYGITATFVNTNDAIRKLVVGINEFDLRLTVGTTTQEITVQVINVPLSNADKLTNIINRLNQVIDGASLDTSKKGMDALVLINSIITGLGYGGSASFVNDADATLQLNFNNNKFNLNVKVGTETQQIMVEISNVPLSNEDKLAKIITLLTQTVDGSSLDTSKTGTDALALINNIITGMGYGGSASFETGTDANRLLIAGTNNLILNVAIGTTSQRVNVQVVNVVLSEQDRVVNIVTRLNQIIDGSSLDTSKTGADALVLINSIISDWGYGGSASFVNTNDATVKLSRGTNSFELNVTVGATTQKVTVELVNVVLSNADKLTNIANKLNETVDGSSLDTSKTGADALTLINSIISSLGYGGAATFVTSSDATKLLALGPNNFTLKITIGTNTQQITVTVTNVKLSSQDKFNNIIMRLNQTINGDTLSTQDTFNDALSLIQAIALQYDSDVNITLVNSGDAQSKLVQGDNTIAVKVLLNGIEQTINVTLVNVMLSQDDADQSALVQIINGLNQTIDGSSLDTSKNGTDALALINTIVKAMFNRAVATFVSSGDLTRILVPTTNSFAINITIGNFSNSVTVQVVNVQLSITDKLAKIIAILNQTIDGSSLDTSKFGADALALINSIITGLGYGGVASFVNADDVSRQLIFGTNSFALNITVGSTTQQVNVQVINVPFSTSDKLIKIIDRLSQTIDGSSLDSSKLGSDALALINSIITALGYGGVVSFVTGTDATRHLLQGANNFTLNLTVGTTSSQVTVQVTNVVLSNQDKLVNIINLLTQSVDGSSLDTSKFGTDALALINGIITALGSGGVASFATSADATRQLIFGTNIFTLNVTVGSATQQVTAQVVNVQLSSADKLTNIVNRLNLTIDGTSLDTSKTGTDALTLINSIITAFGYDAVALFATPSDATRQLIFGTNEFILNVTIGVATQQVIVKIVNVPFSVSDKLAKIIDKLSQNVDGSSLDTSKTSTDALALINSIIASLGYGAMASFVTSSDATKLLTFGANSFVLTITVGGISQQVTVQVINVPFSLTDKLANIVNRLLQNVDGSSLDNSKTGADALILINSIVASFGYGATVSFVTSSDATKLLTFGTNSFVLTITVGGISQQVTVQAINVPLSNQAKLALIIARLNLTVNGTSLDTSKTGTDALALINTIITSLGYGGTATFVTPSDATKLLTMGTNSFVLTVAVGGVSQQVTVQVVNVPFSPADKLVNIINRLLQTVNGASLDNSKTGTDALALINTIITSLGYGGTATFVTPSDATKLLTMGTNSFVLTVAVGGVFQQVTVQVVSVPLSNQAKLASIIAKLNMTVDGSSLDTSKTGTDALNLISSVIALLGNGGTVTFVTPSDATKLLTMGTNSFVLTVAVGDASQQLTVQVVNVPLSNQAKLTNIVNRLNLTVDGSLLDTSKNGTDALTLINNVISGFGYGGTATFVTSSDATKLLTFGTNSFTLTVTVGGVSQQVTVQITNVPLSSADKLANIIAKLNLTVDGTSLDTSKKGSDALALVNGFIAGLGYGGTASFTTGADATKLLIMGTNSLLLTVTVGSVSQQVTVQVVNVPLSSADKLANIIAKLNLTVDGTSLDTSKKGSDALSLINTIITGLGYGGTATFVSGTDATKLLTMGTNSLLLTVTVGSVSQQVTVQVVNVPLSNTDKLANIIAKLSLTVDGTSLDTSKKGFDALALINSVITSLGYGGTATFVTSSDATKLLTFGTNSFVLTVAVGGVFQQVTVQVVNVPLSSADKLANIIAKLNLTIDGSSLDTSKKGTDALTLITSVIASLGYGGTATFVTSSDATKLLTFGTNSFVLTVAVGGVFQQVTVQVVNVPLSSADKLANIIAKLNLTIDGSSLDTSKKGSDALTLINGFITGLGYGGTATFVTSSDATKLLTFGTNSFVLTITVAGVSQQVTVQVVNVQFSPADKLANIVSRLLQNVDGSSLDTSKKGTDALTLINTIITGLGYGGTATFVTSSDATKILTVGTNSFVLTITVAGVSQQVNVQVVGVPLSNQAKLALIISRLNLTIDGSSLDTSKTGANALVLINSIITSLGYGGTATFVTSSDATKLLTMGTNSFVLTVTVGSATQQLTVLVVGVPLSNQAKLLMIISRLNLTIDGSSLDTSKTGTDALALINGIITGLGYGGTATFVTSSDATKLLTMGTNSFVLTVTVGSASQQLTVLVVSVPWSNQAKLAFIVTRLNQTVDGASLDTSKNGTDALALINTIITGLGYGGTATFVTLADATRKLTVGTNVFVLNLTVGSVSTQITVQVTNVFLSDADKLANIIAALMPTVSIGAFNTDNTYANFVTLITSIAQSLYSNATIVLANTSQASNYLVFGSNSITVTITVGTATSNVILQTTSVPWSPDYLLIVAISNAVTDQIFKLTIGQNNANLVALIRASSYYIGVNNSASATVAVQSGQNVSTGLLTILANAKTINIVLSKGRYNLTTTVKYWVALL